ncbi:MAG TPA: lipoyl(octanoyl) transferase LipB [Casimicrobiaceae bacterium]|nr:lipoyl(octanoyl) transferase LipB [Casimicrobiaceae bacterium]
MDDAAVLHLGRTAYIDCWRAMQSFTDARDAATRDEIWLTEHPPVYTLGLAGRREHVHDPGDVPVVGVDRGGQVTYHGPGQLVAYPLLDLRRRRVGIRAIVRSLEAAVIEFARSLDIGAYGKASAPGVYVKRDGSEAKLAALGLRVRNGCTYHGVALNVDMDLDPFLAIDPCGYPGLPVTSLAELGVDIGVDAAAGAFAPILAARLSVIPS